MPPPFLPSCLPLVHALIMEMAGLNAVTLETPKFSFFISCSSLFPFIAFHVSWICSNQGDLAEQRKHQNRPLHSAAITGSKKVVSSSEKLWRLIL